MDSPTMRMMQEGRTSLISCKDESYKTGIRYHHQPPTPSTTTNHLHTLQVQEQQEEEGSSVCDLARLTLGPDKSISLS